PDRRESMPRRHFGWQASHDSTGIPAQASAEGTQQPIENHEQDEALPVMVKQQIQRDEHQSEERQYPSVMEEARRGGERLRHVPHACRPVAGVSAVVRDRSSRYVWRRHPTGASYSGPVQTNPLIRQKRPWASRDLATLSPCTLAG